MIRFFEAWQSKYDSSKYPRVLYFDSIKAITQAQTPDKLAAAVINILHWKDGKVSINPDGSYIFTKTKPNTYYPEKHDHILKSQRFFNWAKIINGSKFFDPTNVYVLTKDFGLWNDTSIVIPTFVLHILNPFIYPLYDQHVERAKKALLAQDISERPLSSETYIEYYKFFHSISDENTIEIIKQKDEALWSFGKWLKSLSSAVISINESDIIPNIDKEQSDFNATYTPDDNFKIRVMILISEGLSQAKAMKTAADELKVKLPDSYYRYPGSHVYRWKQQGY